MGQTDLLTFLPQLLWFYPCFTLFVIFFRAYILPAINSIFITRQYMLEWIDARIQALKSIYFFAGA